MKEEIYTEEKEIVKHVHIMDDIFCDICKNRIGYLKDYSNKKYLIQNYFSIISDNDDNKNTPEEFHICSGKCLIKYIEDEYLKDCEYSSTQYIKINHHKDTTELPDELVEKLLKGEEIK